MTRVLGFDTATAVVSVAATEDGAVDHARIVPPANQGDAEEVTSHLDPEAGATVY